MRFTDHTGLWGQQWTALSSCGRYAIKAETSDPRATNFEALFIPAVWAQGESIGVRPTKEAAEALCEKHFAKPLTIKCINQLAKGLQ